MRLADEGGVSLDAVSAAARNAFAQVTLDPEQLAGQVPTVTGALLLAAVVAHKQPGPDDMPESLNPGAVEIPPPWEMSYPVLLDPLRGGAGDVLAVGSRSSEAAALPPV